MKKDGNIVGNKADAVFTCKSNYSDLFRGHTKSEQLQEREIPLFSAAQAGRIDACDEEPCSLWEQGAQALHQGATAPFLSCSASLCWRKIHSCINSALVRPEEERQRKLLQARMAAPCPHFKSRIQDLPEVLQSGRESSIEFFDQVQSSSSGVYTSPLSLPLLLAAREQSAV